MKTNLAKFAWAPEREFAMKTSKHSFTSVSGIRHLGIISQLLMLALLAGALLGVAPAQAAESTIECDNGYQNFWRFSGTQNVTDSSMTSCDMEAFIIAGLVWDQNVASNRVNAVLRQNFSIDGVNWNCSLKTQNSTLLEADCTSDNSIVVAASVTGTTQAPYKVQCQSDYRGGWWFAGSQNVTDSTMTACSLQALMAAGLNADGGLRSSFSINGASWACFNASQNSPTGFPAECLSDEPIVWGARIIRLSDSDMVYCGERNRGFLDTTGTGKLEPAWKIKDWHIVVDANVTACESGLFAAAHDWMTGPGESKNFQISGVNWHCVKTSYSETTRRTTSYCTSDSPEVPGFRTEYIHQ